MKEWVVPPRVSAASAALKEIGLVEEADMFVRWARAHDPRQGHCSHCGEIGSHKSYCPLGKILSTVATKPIPPTPDELEHLRKVVGQHIDFDFEA